MEKLLRYIETNVQWAIIGVAGVYLLAMVYCYVLQAPVTMKVGQQKDASRPGDIPTAITSADGPLPKLDQAMTNTTNIPVMKVDPLAVDFQKRITGNEPSTYAHPWLASNVLKVSGDINISVTKDEAPGDQPPQAPDVVVVNGLPQVPKARPGPSSSGRSVVNLDAMLQAPIVAAPVGGPPMGMMGMGMPFGPGQVPAPAAAPAPDAAPKPSAPGGNAQRHWVTPAFFVPVKELAASFEQAKIPQQMRTTLLLRVELYRQEQLPDGTWPSDNRATAISPLNSLKLQTLPVDWTDRRACQDYIDWAIANQSALVAPPFYETVKPDVWWEPGTKDPNASIKPVAAPQPGAAKPRTANRNRNVNNSAAGDYPPPMFMPPGGRGGSSDDMPAIDDPDRPMLAQGGPPPNGPVGPPAWLLERMPQLRGRVPSAAQGGQGQQQQAAPAPNARSNYTYAGPGGYFNPASQTKDIKLWAHDDTVQPGKTYRYRIRYKILNPLYARPVADTRLADTFVLDSPLSDWSDPVTLPTPTTFYIASGVSPKGDKVRLDVFTWKDGAYQLQPLELGPGDSVPATEWVLLYARTSGVDDTSALFTTDNGNMMRRDYRTDQNDRRYTGLKKAFTPAKAPAAAPTATGRPTFGPIFGPQGGPPGFPGGD